MKVCLWIFETCDMDGHRVAERFGLPNSERFGGDEECRWYSGDLFAITAAGRTKVSLNLTSIHVQNEGQKIGIDALQVIPAPCLLTDDANVQMIYDGPARLRVKNKPFYSRIGLPLVANEWFGFAFGIGPRPNGTEMRLIAFSSQIDCLPEFSVTNCSEGPFEITKL